MRTLVAPFLLSCALTVGCGGGTQSLASSAEFDLPGLRLGSPDSGGDFGRAVVFVGDLVAVGAPDQAEGRVHLYVAATGELVRSLRSPAHTANGRFGAALAAAAGNLLVGAPGENRAYVVDPLDGTVRATLEGPAPDSEFGAVIAVSGEVWVGAPATDAGRGAVVRFALPDGARTGVISSPNSQLAGSFGASLAAEDGKFLIGAPGERRAYVFDAGAAVLLETLGSPAADGEGFGTSVAFAGGASLVGAPGENRAYLFDGENVRHAFEAPAGAKQFGAAVAADGSHVLVATGDAGADVHVYQAVTGAFERTLEAAPGVTGEPGGVALATNNGLALIGVFQLPDGTAGLAQTMSCDTGAFVQIFRSPSAVQNGAFGQAVVFVGSLIAVGQPGANGSDVYLFDDTGSLVRTLSNPDTGEPMGGALAARGTNELVVGAPGDSMGGSVHIFNVSDGSVVRTFRNPDANNLGGFGFSIAVVAGVDILVGVPFDGAQTSGVPGNALLFNGTTGALIHDLNSQNTLGLDPGSEFGFAVASAGDKLFVGAPSEEFDGESLYFGHVHQFDRTTGSEQFDYSSGGFYGQDRFGAAIAATATEVWIGAPTASYFDFSKTYRQEAGLVFIFDCVQGTLIQEIQSPNRYDFGFFGHALATNGSVVAVGAPEETVTLSPPPLAQTLPREGLVHLYDRATKYRLLRLSSDDEEDLGRFGFGVAVDGAGRLLCGAPDETDQTLAGAGSAYLFRLDMAVSVISPDVQDFGSFGYSVAPLDADRIVVGAPNEDGGGRAWIYDLRDGSAIALEDPQQRSLLALGDEVEVVGNEIFVSAPLADAVLVFGFDGTYLREFTVSGMNESVLNYMRAIGTQLAVARQADDVVDLLNADGTIAQTFNPPGTEPMFGRAIAPIGGLVAVSSQDASGNGVVYLFDPATGAIARTINAPGSIAFPQNFGFAMTEFQGLLAVATVSLNVTLFDPTNGNLVATIPSPQDLNGVFGQTMAANADFLIVSSFTGNNDPGEISLFDTNLNEVDTIDSPNPTANGFFGFAVGAGPGYVVIGAPFEDVNPVGAGRMYVIFAQTGPPPPTFTAELSLSSPNPTQGGSFGNSVAFSGTRLVVSAPDELNGNGRTYVFDGSDGSLQRTITSPNPSAVGRFGFQVAANAGMLAIGAPGETGLSLLGPVPTAGRAYLFNPGTGQLLLSFLSINAQSNGGFGASIAVSQANVAVGAPGENAGAGRVYYFDCTTAVPLQVLELPSPGEGDQFGYAVATTGTTVYVGAPNVEQAFCFNGLTGSLIRTFNAPDDGLFGSALAMHGSNLLIGAPFQPPPVAGTIAVGAVHLIDTTTGSVIRTFVSPNGEAGGLFGWSVASNGTQVLIGAPGENSGAGRAYVFNAATGALLATQESPNAQADGGFGRSVAVLTTNGLVGAPHEDTTQPGAGRAYLNVEETTGQ